MSALILFLVVTPATGLMRDARQLHDTIQQQGVLELPESVTELWNRRATRSLQKDGNSTMLADIGDGMEEDNKCSLCQDRALDEDAIPMGLDPNTFPAGTKCRYISEFASSFIAANSSDCSALQPLSLQCCLGGPPEHECVRRTRLKILSGDYDTVVPPVKDTKNPIPVEANLVYITVIDISVQAGTAEIFVWLELTWRDERLSWTPNLETCASKVPVAASLDGSSEIWVPDYNLLNAVQGVEKMPASHAIVFADGTVYWRRRGPMKAICRFSGVGNTPFGTLGCQFAFSPWASMGFGVTELHLRNGTGLAVGSFQPTYIEYQLDKSESGVVKKASGLSMDDIIYYTFWFRRATGYYMHNLVIPTIVLTYISFGTFLLDLRVGERLGFGISLALVVVAQQIVTSDLIPVADTYMWIDKFVGWSFYWVVISLIESVLIGYIYFIRHDEDYLIEEEKDMKEEKKEHAPDPIDDEEGPRDVPVPNGTTHDSKSNHASRTTFRQVLRWATRDLNLRTLDHLCFVLTLSTYTIFVITMFMVVDLFGSKADPVFISSDDFQAELNPS